MPLAIVALMVLTVLVIALIVLAASEPPISSNHARAAQARAFAHAGVARAVWALGRPDSAVGIPAVLTSGATAPYDGTTFLPLGASGGFFLRVATVAGTERERAIDVTAWTPGPPGPDLRVRAHRRVRAVLARLPFPDPPAALSAGGDVQIHGTSRIGVGRAACGPRAGAFATGDVRVSGAAEVHGSGGVEAAGTAVLASQPTAVMQTLAFSSGDLDLLRAVARCCGTYLGPGSPSTWTDAPRARFDDTTRLPGGGLVFIDTRTAANPTVSTPESDLANVLVTGDAAPPGESAFRGWLVVNGHVRWQASMPARGLVYAQAGLTWSGSGAFLGAVVARNGTGTAGSVDVGPEAVIAYDCEVARTGGGMLSTAWFVKPGSYREVSD